MKEKAESLHETIKEHIKKADVLFEKNDLNTATQELEQAQQLYGDLPSSFPKEKLLISRLILERKNKIYLASNISSLQKAYSESSSGSAISTSVPERVPREKPSTSLSSSSQKAPVQEQKLPPLKVPSPSKQDSSDLKTPQKESSVSQEVPTPPKPTSTVLPRQQLKEKSDSESTPKPKNSIQRTIDDSYKGLLLSTLMIDILNENYEDAKQHLSKIKQYFPDDDQILYYEKKLTELYPENKSEVEFNKGKQSNDDSMSEGKEKKVAPKTEDKENKSNVSQVQKATNQKVVRNENVDLNGANNKFIEKKIALARVHLKRKNFDKVKQIAESVLSLDQNNRGALELKKRVMSDD
jgi:hypothetical protein